MSRKQQRRSSAAASPWAAERSEAQGTGAGSPALALVQDALNSPGQPLDPESRAFFEPRLGHSFDSVRIHTDAQAGSSARMLGARAYTLGHDVFFGAGQYMPATQAGRRVLAHELVHTLQQRGHEAHEGWSMGQAEDPLEREADFVADSVLRGNGTLSIRSAPVGPLLQRQLVDVELEASTPEEAGDMVLPTVSAHAVDPRNHSDFIDRRVSAVGYGIHLGGYLLYCDGLQMPVLLPESYVNFGLTSATSVNPSVHPDRESALNALPVGPPAPGQGMPYAFYRAVGGLIVPTIFSPATAPRTVGTISMAVNALASEVKQELAVLALSLVGSALLRLFYTRLARAGQEKPPPKGEKPSPKGEKPPPTRQKTPSGWPEEVDFGTVQKVLEGRQPLSALTPAQRRLAAAYYRNIANQVRGSRAEAARAFNLERARFLDEGGSIPPGKLNDFVRRGGSLPEE